ncbi:protein kinase domain-containing protein [Mucilaginibacter pedocola]|uniref:non-specific serine/threonine protein kinase n=1 Tax=Mucilaginibacter pedocola TaxID=1792845 RepID=A0A1S9PIB1_9SPHI|nr:lanthionine synthetase LanC family protein [Mucilaginibacter pedocola]OOQ60298.1 hypothetical protein BC343_26460 [Mucilaginibacter pedocola]
MKPVEEYSSDLNATVAFTKSIGPAASYSAYIAPYVLPIAAVPPYIFFGGRTDKAGWLIHISVVRQQMAALLDKLLRYLIATNLPVSIPTDLEQHSRILDGRSGLSNVAKVLNIHIVDEPAFCKILADLVEMVTGFKGPAIYDTISTGTQVYISWGRLPDGHPEPASLDERPGHLPEIRGLLKKIRSATCHMPELRAKLRACQKRPRRLLGLKYVPLQTLKADPKGAVLKCIRLNRLYNIDWCIIKQAERYQSFDDAGRDIRDRLTWQYRLHQELAGKINIPKAYELFSIGEHMALSLQHITGQPMAEYFNGLLNGEAYEHTTFENRDKVLEALINAIRMIGDLHRYGYVHRDINPENFMVTEQHEVYLLDLELCYSLKNELPDPPFALGTIGYMSPQRTAIALPVISDDIYAIGACLIRAFTGTSPVRFNTSEHGMLAKQLGYFIADQSLSRLIGACLHPDPSYRPHITDILHFLKAKRSLPHLPPEVPAMVGRDLLTGAIRAGAATFLSSYFTDENKCWYPNGGVIPSPVHVCFRVLAKAASLDIELLGDQEVFDSNLKILDGALPTIEHQPSLSAMDQALVNWITWLELEKAGLARIDRALTPKPEGTGPVSEISKYESVSELLRHGQYIMGYLDLAPSVFLENRLREVIDTLIRSQDAGGNWKMATGDGSLPFGQSDGIAGIITLLIRYVTRFGHENADTAIASGLGYLVQNRIDANGYLTWPVAKDKGLIDPWMGAGFTGIAYVFILGYERYGAESYKLAATGALALHPEYISNGSMGMQDGLTGLAGVYFEASRVFQDVQWERRAHHIVQVILHTGREINGYRFWPEEDNVPISIRSLTTHAAIVCCLLKCLSPEKVSFPFLYELHI